MIFILLLFMVFFTNANELKLIFENETLFQYFFHLIGYENDPKKLVSKEKEDITVIIKTNLSYMDIMGTISSWQKAVKNCSPIDFKFLTNINASINPHQINFTLNIYR